MRLGFPLVAILTRFRERFAECTPYRVRVILLQEVSERERRLPSLDIGESVDNVLKVDPRCLSTPSRLAPLAATTPCVPALVRRMIVWPLNSTPEISKGELPNSKPSGARPGTSPTQIWPILASWRAKASSTERTRDRTAYRISQQKNLDDPIARYRSVLGAESRAPL